MESRLYDNVVAWHKPPSGPALLHSCFSKPGFLRVLCIPSWEHPIHPEGASLGPSWAKHSYMFDNVITLKQCIVTSLQVKHVGQIVRDMGEHRRKQPLWAGGVEEDLLKDRGTCGDLKG